MTESWEINLTNNPHLGSASYKVEITERIDVKEGETAAIIAIKNIKVELVERYSGQAVVFVPALDPVLAPDVREMRRGERRRVPEYRLYFPDRAARRLYVSVATSCSTCRGCRAASFDLHHY